MIRDFMQKEVQSAAAMAVGGTPTPYGVNDYGRRRSASNMSGAHFPKWRKPEPWRKKQWGQFVSEMNTQRKPVHEYHQNLESPSGQHFKNKWNMPYKSHSQADSLKAAMPGVFQRIRGLNKPVDFIKDVLGESDIATTLPKSDRSFLQSMHSKSKPEPSISMTKSAAVFKPAELHTNIYSTDKALSRSRVDEIYANDFKRGVAY